MPSPPSAVPRLIRAVKRRLWEVRYLSDETYHAVMVALTIIQIVITVIKLH